ncbi:hypothetical protein BGW42_002111 [Actinomortierella wolfii]|nr:hypothetical protein BGW42_002111 [Actinomortierella wolfii]
MNRKSMPNLGLDDLLSVGLLTKSKVQRAEQYTGIQNRSPLAGGYNLQETNQAATSTSNGFPTSVSTLPLHSSTSDTHSAQITHPKPIKANCSKPFSPPPLSNLIALTAKDQHQLRRNSFSNFSVMASVPTPKEQQLYQERFQQQLEEQESLTYSNSIHRPEPTRLTLENLSRQSWSPGIHVGRWQENQQTGQQEMSSKSQASSNQQLHTRSRSQASFHSHTSPAIQSQEQQHQQTKDQHPPKAPAQLYHDSSIPLRSGASSGIDIPNTREPSSHNAVNISNTLFEENLNTASSPSFSRRQSMPVSPPTPSTVVTAITSGTPDWSSPCSVGTPASDASILMGMMSPSNSYHVRNRLSLSSRTAIVRHSSDSAKGDNFSHDVHETGVDIESLDNPDPDNLPMHVDGMIYQARKPKATLIRAIKQIINPRKVAEKDALKSQQDHFAWVEMQKSLKRVRSPEPGSKSDFHQQYFPPATVTTPLPLSNGVKLNSDTAATNVAFADVDPFEALK